MGQCAQLHVAYTEQMPPTLGAAEELQRVRTPVPLALGSASTRQLRVCPQSTNSLIALSCRMAHPRGASGMAYYSLTR